MSSGADISTCGRYRFSLFRSWGDGLPCAFVMLNPSTADASEDDPTIRRCIGFAKSWGYGGIEVVNLYAYRATNPKDLWKTASPIGPGNDDHIREAAQSCDRVVLAWGAHGAKYGRGQRVEDLVRECGKDVVTLGRTKSGEPKHPLYLRADTAALSAQRTADPNG